MAEVDLSVFGRQKTIMDQQQLQAEFDLKKQLLQAQMFKAQRGDDLPAALQLANEYQKRLAAGDVKGASLIQQFAKTVDRGLLTNPDGSAGVIPGYGQAVGGIAATKKGLERGAEKQVDLQVNPLIAGAEAEAKLKKELEFQPQIDSANAQAASQTGVNTADKLAIPILERLQGLNDKTVNTRNPGLLQGVTQAVDSEAATALDLMRQERLNLAAPLAKQLGVNPTDKDFQATLDRIFNVDSTKSSRAAQINNLLAQAKQRQGISSTGGKIKAIGGKNYIQINGEWYEQ